MQLFVDIAKYTSRYMSGKRTSDEDTSNAQGAKKRKTEDAGVLTTTKLDPKDTSNVLFSVPETSFAVPQRKKMTVQLAADAQRLEEGAIKIVHEASGINLAIPFSKIGEAQRHHGRDRT